MQNDFSFDPRMYSSVNCSVWDVELYKEIFDLFDTNDVGYLTPMDVWRAMELFGFNPKWKVVYEIISNIDS